MSKQYNKITIDIAINENKKTLFSLDERIKMIEHNIQDLKNVSIVSSTGCLISFADKIGVDIIVKCLRDFRDFEYEKNIVRASQSQNLNIEFIFYIADKEFEEISSSNIKGIFHHGGFIHDLVPMNVKYEMEKKNNQYIIGITGGVGSGKNFVVDNLLRYSYRIYDKFGKQLEINIIDFDEMINDMYIKLKEPRYLNMRKNILKLFDYKVNLEIVSYRIYHDESNDKIRKVDKINFIESNYFIDKNKIFNILYQEYENDILNETYLDVNYESYLYRLEKIIEQPLLEYYKEKIYNLKGLIILNCPLLIDNELTFLCNNNVILINCDDEIRIQRLKNKGFDNKKIEYFMDHQHHYDTTKRLLNNQIKYDNFGNIIEVDNSKEINFDKLIENIKGNL